MSCLPVWLRKDEHSEGIVPPGSGFDDAKLYKAYRTPLEVFKRTCTPVIKIKQLSSSFALLYNIIL